MRTRGRAGGEGLRTCSGEHDAWALLPQTGEGE
jgi:hypothetical protein